MQENIRVLHIVSKMSFGGVQSFIMNFYRNIDRSKIQFDFLILQGGRFSYDEEIRTLGGKIHTIHSLNSNAIYFSFYFFRFLKKHPEYRIVHVHQNFFNIVPLFVAKLCGVSLRVSHSHSNYKASSSWVELQRWIFRKTISLFATDYFACSFSAAEWLYGKKRSNSNKCKIVHNAIDIGKFSFSKDTRERIRFALGINNKTVLINVGMFTDAKNHEFLIEIFKEYHDLDEDSCMLLIGDGEKKKDLEDMATTLGIEKYILFLGQKENVNAYLMAADLFVFPSKYEGIPIVLIEAQTSGLRCFASSAVPREAIITNMVDILNLSEGPLYWAKHIYNNKAYQRKDTVELIIRHGYDVLNESLKLMKFYESRLSG